MSKRSLIFILLAVVVAFLTPQADAVNWQHDLAYGLKVAKNQGKPVMVDFYTEWCGWCKKLDSDTYSDQRVNEASKKFVCVKIDGDKQPALTGKYGVSGYPTIIFMDSNGNVVSRLPGFQAPDQFLASMNNVLSAMPKPSVKKEAPPEKEGGGFAVMEDKPAGGQRGGLAKTVGQEFVYNGYILAGNDDDVIAQINHKGNTHFVKRGDNFAEFKVVSIEKEKVVLASDRGEVTLEYKKPYKGAGFMNEISRTITEPAETRSLTDTNPIEESFPQIAAGRVRAIILAVSFAILVIFYIYHALCLQLIARKARADNGWMAWIPVLNIFLMLNVARIRYRAILVPLGIFFVLITASGFSFILSPVIGLIFALAILLNSVYFVFLMVYVWYKVAIARGKSSGLAIVLTVLMFVAPLNLISMGYLAFSK